MGLFSYVRGLNDWSFFLSLQWKLSSVETETLERALYGTDFKGRSLWKSTFQLRRYRRQVSTGIIKVCYNTIKYHHDGLFLFITVLLYWCFFSGLCLFDLSQWLHIKVKWGRTVCKVAMCMFVLVKQIFFTYFCTFLTIYWRPSNEINYSGIFMHFQCQTNRITMTIVWQ